MRDKQLFIERLKLYDVALSKLSDREVMLLLEVYDERFVYDYSVYTSLTFGLALFMLSASARLAFVAGAVLYLVVCVFLKLYSGYVTHEEKLSKLKSYYEIKHVSDALADKRKLFSMIGTIGAASVIECLVSVFRAIFGAIFYIAQMTINIMQMAASLISMLFVVVGVSAFLISTNPNELQIRSAIHEEAPNNARPTNSKYVNYAILSVLTVDNADEKEQSLIALGVADRVFTNEQIHALLKFIDEMNEKLMRLKQ